MRSLSLSSPPPAHAGQTFSATMAEALTAAFTRDGGEFLGLWQVANRCVDLVPSRDHPRLRDQTVWMTAELMKRQVQPGDYDAAGFHPWPGQPRDSDGRWSGGASRPASPTVAAEAGPSAASQNESAAGMIGRILSALNPIGSAAAQEMPLTGAKAKLLHLAASADDPQGLKMARDAGTRAGLNRRQRRMLHDAITGQDLTDFEDILRLAIEIKVRFHDERAKHRAR